MAEASSIEWTDATWNPTTGCKKISSGCANCYIDRTPPFRMAGRKFVKGSIPIEFHSDRLEKPLHWRKPRRVFVNSLSDLFHEDIPFEFIDRVFAVMALTPRHTYQVLTKRPERMAEYVLGLGDDPADRLANAAYSVEGEWAEPCVANFINGWSTPKEFPDGNPANGTVRRWPLPNVWLGTSVENQATADERIPHLLRVPAAVRFLSCEPLLGPVDLRYIHHDGMVEIDALAGTHGVLRPHGGINERIDWVIVGGESGPKARPMHPQWARSIRDQCQAAGVAFFFKQWGEFGPSRDHYTMDDLAENNTPTILHEGALMSRVGKKAAGRLLNGREWSEFPVTA